MLSKPCMSPIALLLLLLPPWSHALARPGVLLSPSSQSNWFDSVTVAHPVVLPPTHNDDQGEWQCFYYGRGDSWKACDDETPSVTPFLPTGWIGRATSQDGGHSWTKQAGTEEYHSILAPTGVATDWDGAHIGVGDIVRRSDLDQDTLDMFYFGGSGQSVSLGPEMSFVGLDMQIGRARSTDGGLTWQRLGLCLELSPEEGLFCAFPKVCVVRPGLWRMVYHSFDGVTWTPYTAVSKDQGVTWTRQGAILSKGDEGSWDDRGIGCRAVLPIPSKDNEKDHPQEYLMIYEGVDSKDGRHRLGVAYGKEDGADGISFEKDMECGPILESGQGPLGSVFERGQVGTPYLVRDEGSGALRLYFVCIHEKTFEIGCVISETGDPTQWELITSFE